MPKYPLTRVEVKRTKGFTLVELLLVIGLLGIFAGVTLLVIDPTKMRKKTRDAAKESTLIKLATAIQGYYAIEKAYPSVDSTTSPNKATDAITKLYLKSWPTDAEYWYSLNTDSSAFAVAVARESDENFLKFYSNDGKIKMCGSRSGDVLRNFSSCPDVTTP